MAEREPLEKRSISLPPSQWAWLDSRSVATGAYSVSALLRGLIGSEMNREAQDRDKVAAAA